MYSSERSCRSFAVVLEMQDAGRGGGGAARRAEQLFLRSLRVHQRARCGHLRNAGVRSSTAVGAGSTGAGCSLKGAVWAAGRGAFGAG